MATTFESVDEESGKFNLTYSGSIEDPKLYEFFKNHRGSQTSIADAVERALRLGAQALMADEVSTFIHQFENDLNGRLSSMRLFRATDLGHKGSSRVGKTAERTFENALQDISDELSYGDTVRRTGDNSQDGMLRSKGDRKLGDLEILIAGSELKIAVESKYTSDGPAMGDLTMSRSNAALTVDKHARGQVRGSQANRGSNYVIFITKPGSAVSKTMGSNVVVDHNDMAIYVVADLETGQFEDLKVAYMVGRALTLSLEWPTVQQQHLRSVAALLIRSVNKLTTYEKQLKELVSAGKTIHETASTLMTDYEDDRIAVATAMSYLGAVISATSESALALKVLEIELLTGERLEIKEDVSEKSSLD